MSLMDKATRRLLAQKVKTERVKAGLSKEGAARKAEISSITWKRVEDGLPVQDAKLQAVLQAVDVAWSDGVELEIAPDFAAELADDARESLAFHPAFDDRPAFEPPAQTAFNQWYRTYLELLQAEDNYASARGIKWEEAVAELDRLFAVASGRDRGRRDFVPPWAESDQAEVSDDGFTLGAVAKNGEIEPDEGDLET